MRFESLDLVKSMSNRIKRLQRSAHYTFDPDLADRWTNEAKVLIALLQLHYKDYWDNEQGLLNEQDN